ncbi:MAG: polysaccharide pyruvyl transferase family protein [Thermoleophilaceae bacterium]|nr:polysaccharide pyruvyl transferase family protein [Thermoleophilaceae bacterium]
MSSPRVLIVNAWHDDNKGDAAITLGAVLEARRRWPDCHVTVAGLLNPLPEGAFRHVAAGSGGSVTTVGSLVPALAVDASPLATGLWALKISGVAALSKIGWSPRRLTAALRDTDTVILCGGSNLFTSGRRSVFGSLRLVQLLLPARVAARRRIDVRAWGHSLGPFARRRDCRLLGSVLSGCSEVWLRESASLDALERCGVDRSCALVRRDLAFELTPDDSERVQRLITGLGRFVAVAPRTHPYSDPASETRLVGELARWSRELLDRGLVDNVAVVAQTLGPTEVEDDRPVARRLAEAIGEHARLIEEDLSPMELSALYGHSCGTVGVRLHAAILALNGGAPAFAISYFSPKTPGVMELEGLGGCWADYAEVTADDLRRWYDEEDSLKRDASASLTE